MRPDKINIASKLYECPTCESRTESPESRLCEHCGSELINLSRSRDL